MKTYQVELHFVVEIDAEDKWAAEDAALELDTYDLCWCADVIDEIGRDG